MHRTDRGELLVFRSVMDGCDDGQEHIVGNSFRHACSVMNAFLSCWFKRVFCVVLLTPRIAQGSLWGQPGRFRAGATATTTTSMSAGSNQGLSVGVVVIKVSVSTEVPQSTTLAESSLPWIRDALTTTSPRSFGSCYIFNPTESARVPFQKIRDFPEVNQMLPETLGILCDIVVVVLVDGEGLTNVLHPLIRGAERRVDRSGAKSNLIVVNPAAPNDTWWKDKIVQHEGGQISPHLFGQFEIVTLAELDQQWEQYVYEATRENLAKTFTMYDKEVFPKLLEQVYITLSGRPSLERDDDSGKYSNPVILNTTDTVTYPPNSEERPQRTRRHVEDNHHQVVQEVLTVAQGRLEDLENCMDEVWLNQEKHPMPLLDFGDEANQILNEAYERLQQPLPEALRVEISLSVASQIRRLYKKQLDALRDYYGKRYETVLEEEKSKDGTSETSEDERKEAAARMTESFRAAAQHAIPTLCQVGGELRDADFEYVGSLQGLISDMMEATQLKEDEKSLSMEDEDVTDEVGSTSPRRIPCWCKKLFARAVSLGINYIQGWLAWQGVKRAAIERDKSMPKFPLF